MRPLDIAPRHCDTFLKLDRPIYLKFRFSEKELIEKDKVLSEIRDHHAQLEERLKTMKTWAQVRPLSVNCFMVHYLGSDL
jgi:hypothetical protein